VIGIAGQVSNNQVHVTNIPHWPICDGNILKAVFNMSSFTLINDFAAAG
jgi:glucokinase